MRYVTCNICRGDEIYLVTVQNDFRMVQCKVCKLVYMNPRPDVEDVRSLYIDYHRRQSKDELFWKKLMITNFGKVSNYLDKIFPDGGMVLDVGCGFGYFIQLMKARGWYALGIEPSPDIVSSARRRGLHVIESTIDEVSLEESSFDAITLFYVIEHLPDPLASLQKIWRLLKPSGVLIMRFPHTTPLIRVLSVLGVRNNLYDLPFHLYDFSPKTIRTILRLAGFSSVKVIPGEPTSPERFFPRLLSFSMGHIGKILYTATGGLVLIPGISKTVIAMKESFGVRE